MDQAGFGINRDFPLGLRAILRLDTAQLRAQRIFVITRKTRHQLLEMNGHIHGLFINRQMLVTRHAYQSPLSIAVKISTRPSGANRHTVGVPPHTPKMAEAPELPKRQPPPPHSDQRQQTNPQHQRC